MGGHGRGVYIHRKGDNRYTGSLDVGCPDSAPPECPPEYLHRQPHPLACSHTIACAIHRACPGWQIYRDARALSQLSGGHGSFAVARLDGIRAISCSSREPRTSCAICSAHAWIDHRAGRRIPALPVPVLVAGSQLMIPAPPSSRAKRDPLLNWLIAQSGGHLSKEDRRH